MAPSIVKYSPMGKSILPNELASKANIVILHFRATTHLLHVEKIQMALDKI